MLSSSVEESMDDILKDDYKDNPYKFNRTKN